MERIIGALVLLILLFLIISLSRKNNGSGFLAGLIGGIVGGGLLYKLLSSGSSGSSGGDIDMDSAETATQQSDSSITDMRERASEVSSGQRPESDAPEPSDLYEAVVNMEEPINAFKLMVESSGRDLEDILQKSKTFLELRNDEKEKLNTINEALGPGKDVVYKLRQLSGREDVVAGTEDNIANNIINNIESIESAIEEIESNQSSYEDLLSQEEHQLVNDMRQNLRSLKDIEACIDAISQTSEVEEAISRMTNKAQSHHNLQLTNQEIQKIESTIEQILGMEENIVEKLEELRQIEQQTEKTTQEEINEIKTVLEGANSVENLAQQASEKSDLTEDQKNKILEVTEKLKQVLNTLGADLKTEEQEEEQIEEEASEAEQETVSEEKDLENELEKETDHSETLDEELSGQEDQGSQNIVTTYDAVEQMSDMWRGVKEKVRTEGYEKDDGWWVLQNFRGKIFTYAQEKSGAWGDANWLHVKKGDIDPRFIEKIHYCSNDPRVTAQMVLEAEACLEDLGIQDYVFKFDVDKLFDPSKYKLRTNIVIIYVEVSESDEVIQKLAARRKSNGLPPSEPYKNAERDDDKYFWDDEQEKNFVLKKGNSSL